jgi:hypothetical protein
MALNLRTSSRIEKGEFWIVINDIVRYLGGDAEVTCVTNINSIQYRTFQFIVWNPRPSERITAIRKPLEISPLT